MPYYLTVALTVCSSILYNIILKVTPMHVNPLFSLSITYFIAGLVTLSIYPLFAADKTLTFWGNLQSLNWATYAAALTIVGLEAGTLLAFRYGWNISLFHVVASSTVATLLVPVGLLMFKEHLTGTALIGLIFCFIGLILINYKG